jgi:hypothetical protein
MVREPDFDSRPGRRRLGTRVAAAVAVLLLVPVAACSSSKTSSSSSSSPAATATAPATAATSAMGPAPSDTAAATSQVTQAYEKFFSPSTPLADKAAVLQNGSAFQPVLQGFSRDPRVSQVQAKVSKVEFTSATSATVTYALSLQGQTVLPNATGQAVQENGTWKVADSTLCSLVALSSSGGSGSGGSMAPGAGASSPGIPGC